MNLHRIIPYLSKPNNLFFFFLILGVLVFANGLNHPFMIDDHVFFDEAGRDPKNLWVNFIPDKSRFLNLEGSPTEVYYRPFALIVPKMLYWAVGGRAFGMHLINLLFFITAVWVLALWLWRMSGQLWFGVLTGVFVLMHPLNGIIVNFKTAGIFAIQLMCMVSCADFLLRPETSIKRIGVSISLFMSALFFHESAFILPPVVLLISLIVKKETLGHALKKTAPIWIAGLAYFLLRLHWASLTANIFGKFSGYEMSLPQVVASWFSLQAWYFSKLLFPTGIAIFILKPVVHEGIWFWIFGGAAFWFGIIWMVNKFLNTAWVRLGLLWLFLGLVMLAVGSLFHGQELMIEPHWMVFASIGFFIVLAQVFIFLIYPQSKRIAYALGLLIIFGWMMMGWSYNYFWDDELRYSQHWLKQSPSFTPINMYIARAYYAKGQLDFAAEYYKKALTGQRPDYLMYSNLGSIALLQGRLDEAKAYLERALSIEPKARNAMNVLAVVYAKQGNMDKAQEYFKRSVDADPFDTTAKRNLEFFERLRARKEDGSVQKIILEH